MEKRLGTKMTYFKSSHPEQLVELANEYLIPIRKGYGMCSQIGLTVEDVTRELLTFKVSVGKPFNRKQEFSTERDQRTLVFDMRNAMLGQLGNLLPCPQFRALYSDEVQEITEREFTGPFYDVRYNTQQLGASGKRVISVLEMVLEHQEQARPAFKAAWIALEA